MKWNPQQYGKYSGPRARPIMDLLARVPLDSAATVFDLGCGTGAAFGPLRRRFPDAQIVGTDNDSAMLGAARENDYGVALMKADIATWSPDQKPDLIFSNAALHWLTGHNDLLPRLLGMVGRGGVLAVQMPVVWREPVHTILAAMAHEAPWLEHIDPELRPYSPLDAGQYGEILAPLSAEVDIWETRYLHRLEGDNPVFEWIKGTSLRPILEQLPVNLRTKFSETYAEALSRAYPISADGTTKYTMRRLFIVATAA